MKSIIFKAVIACAIALTLVTVGTNAASTCGAEVAVCRHDGPHGGAGGQ